MARFRGTVEGNTGEASRLGYAKSGINASINGWDSGVYVVGAANGEDDVFRIYATSGSNGGSSYKLIGTVKLVDGVVTFKGTEGKCSL